MNNANMLRNIKWYFYSKCQQSGAEEACWAHNPEVGGSKPPSATYRFSGFEWGQKNTFL